MLVSLTASSWINIQSFKFHALSFPAKSELLLAEVEPEPDKGWAVVDDCRCSFSACAEGAFLLRLPATKIFGPTPYDYRIMFQNFKILPKLNPKIFLNISENEQQKTTQVGDP